MSREVHVRFCEGMGVRFPPATRLVRAFERREEAERFYKMLGQRQGKFGLELSAEKTQVIPFSRPREAGNTSFEFLGFEFRWGKDRAGKEHLERRTSRKKLRNSIKRFTQWCRENRNLRLKGLFAKLNAKLRGYYNYNGVNCNFVSLEQFFYRAMGILKKWLNRHSQPRSYNCADCRDLIKHFKVERPRIVGRPKTRMAASRG